MTEQNEKQAIEGMAYSVCRLENKPENCASCMWKASCENYLSGENYYAAGYRKQSGWISAEKPPEIYRDEYDELIPFLVCCKGTVYPFRAVYDGTNWGDGIGKLKVAYWMPLPEPPKMKGGAE